ncbi:MAG: hypothetical protein JXA06_05685 [Bacteroidetes bacterium]|nr:hypothetical protein [Bacteroidota bacterium]
MKKLSAFLLMNFVLVSLCAASMQSDDLTDYQTKSFSVQKGGLLTVDVRPGAVRIESWSKDEVLIEAEGIDERHPDRLSISQSGNNVSVKYNDRRMHSGNIRFIIKVPSNYNADIYTSGGSIKQVNALTGNFKADTKGGSVSIEQIIGEVDIETGGGSITVDKVEGSGKMKTGGGSIRIGFISGNLETRTGGGSISLRNTGGKVKASTGGGSIKAENTGEWIDLSTGGGSVTLINAKYGAKIKTGGGSVTMKEITGVIDVTTGGGSVRCELDPGSSGNSRIKTGGGEIDLYLPQSANVVVEATINMSHGWGRHRDKYRIRSEFQADRYDKNGDIFARYILNGGGPVIRLETSESDINIRKLANQ